MGTIEGFSSTKDNYQQVLEVLKDRFGNKSFIISSHMEAILKLPDMSGADNTYDKLETHIRSLQSLGINSKQFGPMLVPVLMDRLPPDLALIISREYDSKREDVWELDSLLGALKKEIEARERSGYVSVNSRVSKPPMHLSLIHI